MPANLTPAYFSADRNYREARTPAEKMVALEEMLSAIPKHKGTEHLQGDIKRRISRLRDEGKKKGRGPKRVVSAYAIPRAGAAQVALIGPPNSGKSALVGALTAAPVKVADYPYATTVPVPGMMDFEEIRIQLIDTPPIVAGSFDPEMLNLLRGVDLAVLVLSASDPDVLEQYEQTLEELSRHNVLPVRDPRGAHEVEVVGGAVKALLAVTGVDTEKGLSAARALAELIGERFVLMMVSPVGGEGLDRFRWAVWEQLEMIRVFSKTPGQKAETTEPFYMESASTVTDFALRVHREHHVMSFLRIGMRM